MNYAGVEAISNEFDIVQPGIALFFPNGGETLAVDSTIVIRYARYGSTSPVRIELNRHFPEGDFETIATGVAADSLAWTVTGPESEHCRMRIRFEPPFIGEDISDGGFAILQSALHIAEPEANRLCYAGEEVLIRWNRTAAVGRVRVALVRSGFPEELLGEQLHGDSLLWQVSPPEAESSYIRISHEENPMLADSIEIRGPIVPALSLESLGADTVWVIGAPRVLRWNRHFADGAVGLEIMRDYPSGIWRELALVMGDSMEMEASLPEENHVRFRVLLVENPAIGDTTDRDIRFVRPSLSLISPEPGTRARIGQPLTIRWSRHELGGNVEVFLNRAYPSGAWEFIGVTSGDSLVWTIQGDTTNRARFAVASPDYPAACDTLDGNMEFYVSQLEIHATPPLDTVYVHQTVRFEIWRTDFEEAIDIEIQRTPASDWETIASNLVVSDTDWMVTGPAATQAIVRVKASNAAEPCDTLDSPLTILEPSLLLTNPTPGENLRVGETIAISWMRRGISGGIRIELSRAEGNREIIEDSAMGDSILWQVSGSRTMAAQFCIRSNEYPQYGDSSEIPHAILVPVLELLDPLEEGVDTVGCARPIAWHWIDGAGIVRVERNRHYPSEEWELLATTEETTYVHIPSGPESDSVRYRILAENIPALGDTSGLRRLIAPSLKLNAIGSGTWYVGEEHAISWVRHHVTGEIHLEIARDEFGEEWDSLATVDADSFVWMVTGPETEFARLRVTSWADARYADTTDTPIQIRHPRLTLIEPNGEQDFTIGDEMMLRWEGEGFSGDVSICLWRGRPVWRLDTLCAATPNDSIESWRVAGEEADSCYVVIRSVTNPSLADTSDGVFAIRSLLAKHDAVPYKFELEGNWPNPFNSSTTIRYSVGQPVRVELRVYNILGQEVAVLEERWREPGVYTVSWQAQNYASGMYIVSMRAGGFVRHHRMMLVK
ncbi:MAG: T9SS type A sorting domain-containing protein [Calditrichaeota bacterium]|nr:T9SS type A sorting domain-containing protein [Calditrichota bacterium]